MGGQGVRAYAQNLGIGLFEQRVVLSERSDLIGSGRSEVKHVEREDQVFPSTVRVQADLFTCMGMQAELGGLLSDFCHYLPPPVDMRLSRQTPVRRVSYPDG